MKRLKPAHLMMIRLHWEGDSNQEIAVKLGYGEQRVSDVLNSPEAKLVMNEMQANALDTMAEVAQQLQLAAPIALQRKIALVSSADDRVANAAANDILHMAGHAPTKRLQITQPSAIEQKYDGLTEAELRDQLMNELTNGSRQIGPDGKPLN